MRIAYHPHAEGELVESARYYESQLPFLGGAFLDATEGTVESFQAVKKMEGVATPLL